MDLRGMLNDNGGAAAASSSSKPLPPQQIQIQTQQLQQPHQPPPLPSTPIQNMPQQPFRDYGQTQQSPIRQFSPQEYGAQNMPPGAFASSPYQTGPGPGPYANRPPQPPPLQQMAPNDLRSPSIGSGPVPSPYRPTPTSSVSTASGGYPFPPPQQTPTSPVQRHQYPPASAYHRDGYPQPSGPVGMTGPPGASSYMQGPSLPQTPPIGTAGVPHPYPHQRSQSSHSTPTPTSAQSQSGQYGASYPHGSPVVPTHPLPQLDHQQRQSSQPPTPIAGPLSGGPRGGQSQTLNFPGAQSQTLNFPQPPSPYQQHRLQSTTAHHPLPSQSSPPPPPPPSLPRHPSSQTIYESHAQELPRRPQSHSERERSVSISPKTRVPSLPSSTGRPGTSVSDSQNLHPPSLAPAMDIDRERVSTPAKRKLEDRELRSDELERRGTRPPPFQDVADRSVRGPESAQAKRPRRKMIHKTAPIWAQPAQGRNLVNPNCILYRPSAGHNHQVNGKSESLVSRHTSPEERRSTIAPQAAPPPPPPAAAQQPMRPVAEQAYAEGPLGPWEPSITNQTPQGSMSKRLCDFFFATVVSNDYLGEMQSRGIKFEIEAKFGVLIDKHTQGRVALPIETNCILSDNGNWLAFRSSMTEAQHKFFNDFLNEMVKATHPDNKANVTRRLPVKYQHRRQVDKFFDLPANTALPGYVTDLFNASGHRPKVRITYDQKTNEVLAKIIKTKVQDIHLFLPESALDCRISVNLEMDWDGPVEALESQTKRPPAPDRMKDRLSYSHGHYQIDLTQVTQVNSQRPEKQHELEIEVNPAAIIEQGQRAASGQPHQYPELVEGFLNNICLLARKASTA
ncbi:CYTH-like domain containing protein [Rhypophila decipiens]